MEYYQLLPPWAWILVLFAGIALGLFLDSRSRSFWNPHESDEREDARR